MSLCSLGELYSIAAGNITKLVHNTVRNMFRAITSRVNTKKDAIPTPKFPMKYKVHCILISKQTTYTYLQSALSELVIVVFYQYHEMNIFSN